MDPFDMDELQEARRPALITVFAILTLIGTLLTVVSLFVPFDFLTSGAPSNIQPPEMPGYITYGQFVLALLKGAAAILLLQMRKMGFYMYAAAESVYVVLSIIGAKLGLDWVETIPLQPNMPIDPGTLIIAATGISLLVSLVWIGGYASQLNKMQ